MASKQELRALVTLAGKVDPSLRRALQTAAKDTQGVSGKLKKLSSTAGKAFKAVGKTVAVAGGAIITAGAALIGKGTQWASELQEVQNVVNVTFGKSASLVDEWSRTVTKSFGLSEVQAKQFSGTMGAMLKSSGVTDKLMTDMSMNLAALAGDMASFYNLDHNSAWEKIRAGMSGQTTPLKQLGIDMSVANLEAFALSKGINASWSSMDQASQAMVRYAYLIGATKDAQGDFERTQDSFSNQMRLVKTNFQQVVTEASKNLLPTFAGYLKMANEFMESGGLSSLLGMFTNLLPPLLEVAKGVLPVFMNLMDKLGKTVAPVLLSVLTMLVEDVLVPMTPLIGEVVTELLPPMVELFFLLFNGVLKPAMPILIKLIQGLLPLVAVILRILVQVLEPLLPVIMMLVEKLLPPMLSIIEALLPALEALTPFLVLIAEIIGVVLAGAIEAVIWLIEKLTEKFTGSTKKIADDFKLFGKLFGMGGKSPEDIPIQELEQRGMQVLQKTGLSFLMPKQKDMPQLTMDQYAKGGFASRPSIFGDAGLETAIPVKYGDPRSLSLLNQTARYIGAQPFAYNRSIEQVPVRYETPRSISTPARTEQGGKEETSSRGITIIYSPQISGVADPEKTERILREDKERLKELLEDILDDEGRVSFA